MSTTAGTIVAIDLKGTAAIALLLGRPLVFRATAPIMEIGARTSTTRDGAAIFLEDILHGDVALGGSSRWCNLECTNRRPEEQPSIDWKGHQFCKLPRLYHGAGCRFLAILGSAAGSMRLVHR